MHHSCVQPSQPGGMLQCPICKVEGQLESAREDGPVELPRWHEAEVGAPVNRRNKTRSDPPVCPSSEKGDYVAWYRKQEGLDKPMSSEVRKASFPATRWPTEEEARLNGY